MASKIILLVEDNPDDEELTLLALEQSQLPNEVVVVHDGVEALEYLLATDRYLGRDPLRVPQLVLLDLRLPKLDGLAVLTRLRADLRTQLIPIVVLRGCPKSPKRGMLSTTYSVSANEKPQYVVGGSH